MTPIKIPENRRLEIKEAVLQALQNSSMYTLPIKIKAIVRSFTNIRLISFSKHMRAFDLTYKQMIAFVESNDACTDYYAKYNLYYIYYNDIDKNITISNRYRWNIAHELGHILLEHHIDNHKTRIFRSKLTDEEYNMLEAEADYFAQLILVPHSVLLGFKVDNYRSIRNMCKISDPAAKRRFFDFLIWKRHIDPNETYDRALFYLYYPFIFKRECRNCGAALTQRHGKYCPICGKITLQWGEGKMKYSKMETYGNGKVKICPVCANEETDIDGDFCQICNTLLVNKCDDRSVDNYSDDWQPCGQILPANARYCPKCGSHSTFFNDKILKPWDWKEPSFPVGKGFMNIPDSHDLPDGVEDEGLPFN